MMQDASSNRFRESQATHTRSCLWGPYLTHHLYMSVFQYMVLFTEALCARWSCATGTWIVCSVQASRRRRLVFSTSSALEKVGQPPRRDDLCLAAGQLDREYSITTDNQRVDSASPYVRRIHACRSRDRCRRQSHFLFDYFSWWQRGIFGSNVRTRLRELRYELLSLPSFKSSWRSAILTMKRRMIREQFRGAVTSMMMAHHRWSWAQEYRNFRTGPNQIVFLFWWL
jgi:hypothetical protein